MKLFIIGAGTSANIIIENLYKEIETFYLYDIDSLKIEILEQKYINVKKASLSEMNKANFVVECASGEAVKQVYKTILNNNINFIILSTGIFSNNKFRDDFIKRQKLSKSKIMIPSGAIGGLDLIYSIKSKINEIELITTKSPKSLNLKNITKKTIVFEGTSTEAIKKYPKNINVAVTLSLAIDSFKKIRVKIVADPKADSNSHLISVKSEIGSYDFNIKNNKSENHGTSILAPLSIVGLLKKESSNFKIGI